MKKVEIGPKDHKVYMKRGFCDQKYLIFAQFFFKQDFGYPLLPKQKLVCQTKLAAKGVTIWIWKNAYTFEIIQKIGNHLEKSGQFWDIQKIGNHLEKSGLFWKYWDSLKGFFLLYAQKLSGRAKTFQGLSQFWYPASLIPLRIHPGFVFTSLPSGRAPSNISMICTDNSESALSELSLVESKGDQSDDVTEPEYAAVYLIDKNLNLLCNYYSQIIENQRRSERWCKRTGVLPDRND